MNKIKRYIIEAITSGLPLIIIVITVLAIATSLVLPGMHAQSYRAIALLGGALKSVWVAIAIALLTFNNRIMRLFWLFLILIIFEIYVFLLVHFSCRFTAYVVSVIMQSNPNEASEFLTSGVIKHSFIIISIASIAIILLAYWALSKFFKAKKAKIITWCNNHFTAFTLLIAGSFIVSLALNSSILMQKFENTSEPESTAFWVFRVTDQPIKEIYNSLSTRTDNRAIINAIKKGIDDSKTEKCKYTTPDIVLIIGESHNKPHSSLYGYQHDTEPYMTKEKEKGNLLIFTDVVSKYQLTKNCVNSMLSTRDVDIEPVEQSNCIFPGVFKKNGYKVTLLDNQITDPLYEWEYSLMFLLKQPELRDYCIDYHNDSPYGLDGALVESEDFKKAVKSDTNNLVIIHLMGQHTDASLRYPHTREFEYFTADSIHREREHSKKISEYDNATRYNDYILSKIVDAYRDKDAILIYTSDHGECIYDDQEDTFLRTLNSDLTHEQIKISYEVPFFIWCSDININRHPEIYQALINAQDRPFQNDDISHLLFEIAGIDCDEYQPQRSLINESYQLHDRLLYNQDRIYNYDALKPALDTIRLRTYSN